MEFTANILSSVYWQATNAVNSSWSAIDANTIRVDKTLTLGVGTSQATCVYHLRNTLAANATQTLAIAAGLTNQFGESIGFSVLKGFGIRSLWTDTAAKAEINLATSPFAHWMTSPVFKLPLLVGGEIILGNPGMTGWPVTASTHETIAIQAIGGEITYDLVLFGLADGVTVPDSALLFQDGSAHVFQGGQTHVVQGA